MTDYPKTLLLLVAHGETLRTTSKDDGFDERMRRYAASLTEAQASWNRYLASKAEKAA